MNMNYYSEIISSVELENVINIPDELKNRDVELIIIPFNNHNISKNKSLYGILSKYKNSELIEKENFSWLNQVVEQNGNS